MVTAKSWGPSAPSIRDATDTRSSVLQSSKLAVKFHLHNVDQGKADSGCHIARCYWHYRLCAPWPEGRESCQSFHLLIRHSFSYSDFDQAMHAGVLRDMEQQRIKRERQLDFDMQAQLEKEYRKLQTVSDGRNTE